MTRAFAFSARDGFSAWHGQLGKVWASRCTHAAESGGFKRKLRFGDCLWERFDRRRSCFLPQRSLRPLRFYPDRRQAFEKSHADASHIGTETHWLIKDYDSPLCDRRPLVSKAMMQELPDRPNALVLSYLGIRRAIGLSGLLLPILLAPGGWLIFGIDFQDNISSYYHTPMRDVFVGTLCAIGIFLFCYRGYDWVENWTANLGCASALGVALFPLDANSDPLLQKSPIGYLHTFSGGVFFLTLAFYSLYHFPRDARREGEPHLRERDWIYRTSGIAIVASILTMGGHLFLLPAAWKQTLNEYNFLLWMEWLAVWAFAAAWLAKGRTIVAEIAIDILAYSSDLVLHRKDQQADR